MIVIYNEETKYIYTAGDKDDTVVPGGHTKIEIEGSIETFVFPAPVCYCRVVDGKIVAGVIPDPPIVFTLDAVDAWLISEPSIQPYAAFFPIISRATEKNSKAGYQLMVIVARSEKYEIPQNIIDLVVSKLAELGANVGG
jgi:hypothetical protein